MQMTKCPKCGSQNIDKGKLSSTQHTLGYRSDKRSILSFPLPFKAYACLNCGYIESYIDPQTLKEKTQK